MENSNTSNTSNTSNILGNPNNVESSSKRLGNIMKDISFIYANSHGNLTLNKKKENYEKVSMLFNEATLLFDNLQAEINGLESTKGDQLQIDRINEYVNLLSKNTNFDETMHILRELCAINGGLPNKSEVFDNIEDEIMYEIQEVLEIK